MIRSFLRNSLSKNLILPLKKGARFIFIYHDVSETTSLHHSKNYSTTPQKFKEQIDFLSDIFEWVDLDTIHREEPFRKNVATLTFDDGFKSVQTEAMPFLAKKGIPFSLFLSQCAIKYNRLWVSDLEFNQKEFEKDYGTEFSAEFHSINSFKNLEKNKDFQNKLNSLALNPFAKEQVYLNAADIINLHKKGVIIGNHGSFHANLSMCHQKSMQSEIVENKTFLEHITQSKVMHYAIAFGKKEHYTQEAYKLIRGSGHDFVYSSNPTSYSPHLRQKLIPRIGITENSTKEIMFYINRQFIKKTDL